MQTHNKDGFFGLGMALLFTIMLVVVIPKAVVVPAGIKVASTRPDFWPRIICAALVVLSLAHAGTSFLAARRAVPSTSHSAMHLAGPLRVMLLSFAYYLAVEPLGIILSSTLAFVALARIYGEKRLPVVVLTAVVLPLALSLLFSQIMGIPLPTGTIF